MTITKDSNEAQFISGNHNETVVADCSRRIIVTNHNETLVR